jgi:hypothetical protein
MKKNVDKRIGPTELEWEHDISTKLFDLKISKEVVRQLEEMAEKKGTTVEQMLSEWLSHEFLKMLGEAMETTR